VLLSAVLLFSPSLDSDVRALMLHHVTNVFYACSSSFFSMWPPDLVLTGRIPSQEIMAAVQRRHPSLSGECDQQPCLPRLICFCLTSSFVIGQHGALHLLVQSGTETRCNKSCRALLPSLLVCCAAWDWLLPVSTACWLRQHCS
jgi:hypothetical protein